MRDNMSIRRKGAACDPCCNDWKEKLKFLWERYREVVRAVKADARTYWPDGEGIVTLPGILSIVQLTDMQTYWLFSVDVDADELSLTDKTTYWTLEVQ